MLTYLLCCPHYLMCDAWADAFKSYEKTFKIEVYRGKFEDALNAKDVHIIVSAGNSFGEMGGGYDLALRNYFGVGVQEKVRDQIASPFFNRNGLFLSVGDFVIVDTGKKPCATLVYVPTMEAPLIIGKTHNVFIATLAALKGIGYAKQDGKFINTELTVLLPAFGEGTGSVSCASVAKQMRLAFNVHLECEKLWGEPANMWKFRDLLTEAMYA